MKRTSPTMERFFFSFTGEMDKYSVALVNPHRMRVTIKEPSVTKDSNLPPYLKL